MQNNFVNSFGEFLTQHNHHYQNQPNNNNNNQDSLDLKVTSFNFNK